MRALSDLGEAGRVVRIFVLKLFEGEFSHGSWLLYRLQFVSVFRASDGERK